MRIFLIILFVILITLFAFGQSLNFSINGDDWLSLWRYIKDFTTFQSHFVISNYQTGAINYTLENIIMGLIYRLFSFNPFPYYLISLIFRILAAISLYFAVSVVTKNKIAGFFSAILFAGMFAGIETTNWVSNMNTYLALALLNLIIFLNFKVHHKILSKFTILLSLLFGLCFFIAPTRMHGLLFLIPSLSFLKVKIFQKGNYKDIIFESAILYIPTLIIRLLTSSTTDKIFLSPFIQALNGKDNPAIHLFSSLGNSLIPDIFFQTPYEHYFKIATTTFLIYASLVFYFYKERRKFFLESYFALFALSMSLAFLIIPLLINPSIVLTSDHRYLLIPGTFLLTSVAVLFSTLYKRNNILLKQIAITLTIFIISFNIYATNIYFSAMANSGRLAKDSNIQFDYIRSHIQKPGNDAPLALLFIPGRPEDGSYIYNAINFGFSFHLMLIDPRFGLDNQNAPFVVDNLGSLLNVLSGPESSELNRYGYKPVKIPLENVYVFNLADHTLTDITSESRPLILQKLNSYGENKK